MISILEMPRLPAPMATRAPGLSAEAIFFSSSSAFTATGISANARCGKCWRTGTKLGLMRLNTMIDFARDQDPYRQHPLRGNAIGAEASIHRELRIRQDRPGSLG